MPPASRIPSDAHQLYTHTLIHTHTLLFIHTLIHTHTHTHTLLFIHTLIHTHTVGRSSSSAAARPAPPAPAVPEVPPRSRSSAPLFRPIRRMADVRLILQIRQNRAARRQDVELALLLVDHPAAGRDHHRVGHARVP